MAGKQQVNRRKPIVRRPARTVEGRESQLVALAVDLSERQLADGSASAQVISHFLKLGSSRERLEQERLRNENELLRAKIDQIATGQRSDEMYVEALDAMRRYSGQDPVEPEYDDDDY